MKRRMIILAAATKLQSDLHELGDSMEIVNSIMHAHPSQEKASRADVRKIRAIIDRPIVDVALGRGHPISVLGRKGIIKGESRCKTCWRIQYNGVAKTIVTLLKSKVEDAR